ncbi:hypothetical protein PybrP1_011385 [[Pythium] brassicae (nom. inval.)]|nr:hypothetical protein PybrP1_011385 [[Pythium] brassicae (nom. inval.)]
MPLKASNKVRHPRRTQRWTRRCGVGDVLLFEELVHNSCHEDICLSRAYAGNAHAFQHNDLDDLAAKLRAAAARGSDKAGTARCVLVVVESLYSMDGDVAPLGEMAVLCEQLGASLFVDEAHGTGVYCPQGPGVPRAVGLDAKPQVIAHEFCAAGGAHALVLVLALVQYFKRRMEALLPSDSPIQRWVDRISTRTLLVLLLSAFGASTIALSELAPSIVAIVALNASLNEPLRLLLGLELYAIRHAVFAFSLDVGSFGADIRQDGTVTEPAS